jgi:hypothetical protein
MGGLCVCGSEDGSKRMGSVIGYICVNDTVWVPCDARKRYSIGMSISTWAKTKSKTKILLKNFLFTLGKRTYRMQILHRRDGLYDSYIGVEVTISLRVVSRHRQVVANRRAIGIELIGIESSNSRLIFH